MGTEYKLSPTAPGPHAQGLWIPQGSYEIKELVGNYKGTYTAIDVQAGKVTDLGGLTWASVGDRERALLPLRHRDLSEQIEAAISPFKEHVSVERNVWSPSLPPKAQPIPTTSTNLGLIGDLLMMYSEEVNKPPLRSQLRASRSLDEFSKIYTTSAAPLLGEPSFDESGTLFIGSNFGQLRMRTAQGRWQSIDTGTISPITAVEAGAGRILVGTHDGHLLLSADHARTWARIHSFDGAETVLSLQLVGDRYVVLTGRFTGPTTGFQSSIESLQVYTFKSTNQTQPQLIRKMNLPSKIPFPRLPALQGFAAGKFYFVNAVESVERLDLTSITWKTVSPPHDVSHLRGTLNGTIVTAFKAQGAFSKLSTSNDFGETWSSAETPPYPVNDVRMESTVAGTASRWDTGLFAVALQLMKYDQSSKSWKSMWTAPQSACTRTIRDVNGKEAFCVSGGGSIFLIGPDKLVPEFLAN